MEDKAEQQEAEEEEEEEMMMEDEEEQEEEGMEMEAGSPPQQQPAIRVPLSASPSPEPHRQPLPQSAAPPTETAAAAPVHLSHGGSSKRQRRPNVRLNEIGDSSLANVVEYLLKRKRGHNSSSSNKTEVLPQLPSSGMDPAAAPPAAGAPGKPSKKPRISSKLKKDQMSNSRSSKPYEKAGNRKPSLRKGRYPINKHPRNPRLQQPLPPPDENGNSWMHKAITGLADGFLEAADGCVYGSGSSDTEKKHQSPANHDNVPVVSSFDSGSPKGTRKNQATKQKKRTVSTQKTAPVVAYTAKGDAEEKDEPSSSDVQELRAQVPAWERGVLPLEDKVREWIKCIGLEKYAPIFQHHEVTNDVVPLLTMEDLKEMGISAVGARRKLFNEIMKLRQNLMIIDDHLSDEK